MLFVFVQSLCYALLTEHMQQKQKSPNVILFICIFSIGMLIFIQNVQVVLFLVRVMPLNELDTESLDIVYTVGTIPSGSA